MGYPLSGCRWWEWSPDRDSRRKQSFNQQTFLVPQYFFSSSVYLNLDEMPSLTRKRLLPDARQLLWHSLWVSGAATGRKWGWYWRQQMRCSHWLCFTGAEQWQVQLLLEACKFLGDFPGWSFAHWRQKSVLYAYGDVTFRMSAVSLPGLCYMPYSGYSHPRVW